MGRGREGERQRDRDRETRREISGGGGVKGDYCVATPNRVAIAIKSKTGSPLEEQDVMEVTTPSHQPVKQIHYYLLS